MHIAYDFACDQGFLHFTISYELRANAPRAAFALRTYKGCATRLRASHIGHEVHIHRIAADIGHLCGILKDERGIVLDGGYVPTAQSYGMCRGGQAEEVEHTAAFLSPCGNRKNKSDDEEKRPVCHHIMFLRRKGTLFLPLKR